jgi:hypothetical protein
MLICKKCKAKFIASSQWDCPHAGQLCDFCFLDWCNSKTFSLAENEYGFGTGKYKETEIHKKMFYMWLAGEMD